jgi:CheY-like chemotaxis protein
MAEAAKKILIVEDHADMRDLIVRQVEVMGFQPLCASNGKEAIDKAISEKPDLIVMDILMPYLDGREVTRLLRSNPETRDIPILAMTVLFADADLRTCLDAGCNDYLVKPFTLQDLKRKVQQWLA